MADAEPGLTIGVSGPSRQRLTHQLMRLALHLYGARSVFIRPGAKVDVALLDGLILSGGTHVHPERYGQQPEVTARFDRVRDETDWRLLEECQRLHLPVLGICRGAQLLNVFRGGSLCQNVTPLRVHTRHRPLLLPLQTVRLVRNSLLGGIMRATTIGANRIHSQAIKRLGRGLRVVAIDNDYFVQAVESEDGPWQLGVQWHPEYLLYHPLHRRIFESFVREARRRKLLRLGHSEGPTL
ncbi:gamma-glutamyl-gamma-aminobutyrate hydrolase family protein [Marinobacter halodurans]|uniref:Gamma-glutamyl-gamma-aminobutyrate hydrolase family protein n=1 Tax=Marinobacter halodurans TaxID=2528979 RepID=A0ABY1ZQQ4_9GAMM|nr:gamma-glutamyl-gamma-aminobutyrate hydrolase family protein [Marinobacter halodurans]TBW59461.1 gamma-glutamyl-gamma-aminobutyrate hydrolase family protein [Marinobacter halodurans]